MTLKDVLRACLRGWWLPALGLAIGLVVGQLVAWHSTPLYRSSTSLFVAASDPTDASAAYTGNLFTQGRVASYVQLVEGQALGREVIDELRLPLTPAQLASEVTATTETGTVILDVTVTDPSARRAQQIAASYGRHAITDITALERPSGATVSAVKVSTVQPAVLPPTPVSPNRLRDVALGGLIGLLLGVALAVLRARRHPVVRTPADVESATGAALLATLPRDRRVANRPVEELLDPAAPGSDAIRLLRTRLYGAPGGDIVRCVVVVCSARRREGRSTVAAQLATALARTGHTTLLVDADPQAASLTRGLGLAREPGFMDTLAGTVDVLAAVRDRGAGRPAFLPAGRPAEPHVAVGTDPAALLDSPAAPAVLDTLRRAYDCVVVDAPPLLADAGAAPLAALGDGCVLVVREGRTRRKGLSEAARLLSWYGGDLLGVVLGHGRSRRLAGGNRPVRYRVDRRRARSVVTPAVPFGPAGRPEIPDRPPQQGEPVAAEPPLLQQQGR